MTTNNKISNLISSQVPFFVRNDHPNFIVFLEKYYEYLEQNGNLVDRAKNIPNSTDIDMSEDIFAEKLYYHFINLLPKKIVADKALVLKYAKDFYRSKGTEKSVSFLLNILFGYDNASFYYPKTDILKASDGKWFLEKSLRVGNIFVDDEPTTDPLLVHNFTSRKIEGNLTGATAIVESVNSYFEYGNLIYELRISNVFRSFDAGESISATYIENGVTKTLRATTFGGSINSARVLFGGSQYQIGTPVPVESNTGSGASVVISGVTRGNLGGIGIVYSGAGFANSNIVLVTGGGGSGANANVTVNPDGTYHPNSYNIVSSTISLEANTLLSNLYSNLNSTNVNTSISNAISTFVYANTGPIEKVFVISSGSTYTSVPSLDVQANTRVRSLGILGRMEIVNGGINYVAGDKIEFTNVIGGYGAGAAANVKSVSANGSITEVQFEPVPGHIIGGAGYTNDRLPIANVVSATGNGANVIVKTTLGDGEILVTATEAIGRITSLSVVAGGSDYDVPPTLNLSAIGDGTAQAAATIIAGVFTFPGRFLNDDGMISSFNFLENRDYYQNYSYVVRLNKSIDVYEKAILDLTHPGGMKLFGEFLFVDEYLTNVVPSVSTDPETKKIIYRMADYYTDGDEDGSIISVNAPSHSLEVNSNVYIEFVTGSTANVNTVSIVYGGSNYANGYIIFEDGSGSDANASVVVNDEGEIVSTIINDNGQTYSTTDVIYANVEHLITYNVNSITINDGSTGYSNGYIVFTGGSGKNINAHATVNATGAISNIEFIHRGTGYSANDNVVANVSTLVGYNVATINVSTGGSEYSNGFITFQGGSGFGANANVSVNSTGSIVSVTLNKHGYGYKLGETVEASVSHLKYYRVDNLYIASGGSNYKNGFIIFENGSGSGANGTITVNPETGSIAFVNLVNRGNLYTFGDTLRANIDHLITNNIANVSIVNAGYGYSNGFITFESSEGSKANVAVTVNTNGSIVSLNTISRGTGYSNSSTVTANVQGLLTYNVASIAIANAGSQFSNGFIRFVGGSGRNANANVTVNATGAIISVKLNANGTGYLADDVVEAKVSQLITYGVSNVIIEAAGSGYSNGFITFSGGSGINANANVRVNSSGSIVGVTVIRPGRNYTTEDYITGNVSANVVSLGGTNAVLTPILAIGNSRSANLTLTLAKNPHTASISVSQQRGGANGNVGITLIANGNSAILPVTLQRSAANANLTVVLQKGEGNANLIVNLQSEELNTITDSIFIVENANSDWFTVQHPNTANIFGTAYVGVVT
jgi:hypothetical protein